MSKIDILSLTKEELEKALADKGQPRYRVSQIYDWLHIKCVDSFDKMTNISRSLWLQFDDNFVIIPCSIEKRLNSLYDDTVKYLYSLHDGETVESVVMRYKYGGTICISTQVGCKMGCSFCASGIGGFRRNLLPSEMLGQIYTAQRDLGIKVSHVVLMGMGEPLDNFENVLKFLRLISDGNGQNIGMRKISLSTCGIVPKIYELMKQNLPLTLSVSLHAPNDTIRSAIMPVNKRWGIDELLTACRAYEKTTSRRVSFEYTMIDGVNDSDACAEELSKKLRGSLCHVNLIPLNEVIEKGNRRSADSRTDAFCRIMLKNGINTTIRRSLGMDIQASCGQLRRSAVNRNESEA